MIRCAARSACSEGLPKNNLVLKFAENWRMVERVGETHTCRISTPPQQLQRKKILAHSRPTVNQQSSLLSAPTASANRTIFPAVLS